MGIVLDKSLHLLGHNSDIFAVVLNLIQVTPPLQKKITQILKILQNSHKIYNVKKGLRKQSRVKVHFTDLY